MSSILLTNSPEEQLSRLKEEIVKSFCDVVIVASRKDAEACLSHCKWNQEDAIRYFFGEYTEANPEIAWSQAVCNLLFLCTFYYGPACFIELCMLKALASNQNLNHSYIRQEELKIYYCFDDLSLD